MKNISAKKLILIKKCVAIVCAVLCLVMMLCPLFDYTSSSTIGSSGVTVTDSEGFSLFSFLINKDLVVLDTQVKYLHEIFTYSQVVMWIAMILTVVSLLVLLFGLYKEKGLFSKIGSIILIVAMVLLFTVTFEKYEAGITVRYLSIFNPCFIIALIASFVGLFSTITLKDK